MLKSKHTFTFRPEAGGPQHSVTIEVPSWQDLTPEQQQTALRKAVSSWTIDIQRPLRKRAAKGMKGDALSAEAQKFFNLALDAKPIDGESKIMDAEALELTPKQSAHFEGQGYTVLNKDWATSKSKK